MTFDEWVKEEEKKKKEKKEKDKLSFDDWVKAEYGVGIAPAGTNKPVPAKEEKKKGIGDYLLGVAATLSPAAMVGKGIVDISKMILGTSDDDEQTIDLVQKGAFEDGYQFGDVAKTVAASSMTFGTHAIKGAVGTIEGISDFGHYLTAAGADLIGLGDYAETRRDIAKRNLTDELFAPATDFIEENSIWGRTTRGAAESGGQVALTMATGGAGQAAGLGKIGVTLLTSGTQFLSGTGSGISEAYQGGATDDEAYKYGIAAGAADAVWELVFSGLGKAVNAVGFSKGLSSADDMAAKAVSKFFKSQAGKNVAEFAVKAGFEGLEEVGAGFTQAVAKKLTYMSEEDFGKILKDENLFEQFVIGSLVSAGAQVGDLGVSTRQGRDFVTGLTKNEQAVVDKVYKDVLAEEGKNGKVSSKRKAEIYDDVLNQLEKGYISTDVLEEVLGGDSYKAYTDSVNNEKTLTEQQKTLQAEYDELYQMKNGDKSDAQIDRQAELKKQLAEIQTKLDAAESETQKAKLSKSVYDLAKNDRLAESYNERERRKQHYEADLSKYSAEEQKTIQKAIDSGILNNTNRTHEFVDLIAKISAEKGVPFDFANNEKLKESGFALKGVTVNGLVNENGITINIESAKALNRVVGHEIAHVLEGTDHYGSLQEAITKYAKSKGEYDSRLAALKELYKDKEGYTGEDADAKIEQELVADLVGDYLFTDKAFVENLYVGDRGLFQKIFDEVKYLCKVVTAGSKEARQLEKVKKTFQEVYRAETKNPTVDGGVKYSLGSIVGASGKNYGVGVYLDSTLLSNLTEAERIDMVKEYVKELGGSVFTAYDNNGDAVDIQIVESSKKFKNKSGKRVPVNKDLTYRLKNEVKQEAIALVDELVQASTYHGKEPATHPHDWLDNNGANDWDLWKTYIQDKENAVWEASLRIANSANGDKILYDIFPIKMVEGAGTAATTTTNNSIRNQNKNVNTKNSLSNPNANIAPPIPSKNDIHGKDIALGDIPIRTDIRQKAQAADVDTKSRSKYDNGNKEGGTAYADTQFQGRSLPFGGDWRNTQSNTQGQVARSTENGRRNVQLSNQSRLYGRGSQGSVYTTDSEGRSLTKEQAEELRQTAVRDNRGRPLAVYHATDNMDFTTFEKGDTGFHFGSKAQADAHRKKRGYISGRTFRVYLNIENPIVVSEDIMGWHAGGTALRLWSDGIFSDVEMQEVTSLYKKGDGYDSASATRLREILESKGYDGISYPNSFEGEGMSYMAFHDNQIIRTQTVPFGNALAPQQSSQKAKVLNIAPPIPESAKKAQPTEKSIAPPLPESVKKVTETTTGDENIIQTVKDKLNAKVANSTEEMENTKALRDWVKAQYESKIADAQAKYDAKANKDTKVAIGLKNRIENLKRVAADLDADLAKRISNIEGRIAKTKAKMETPEKKDILEVKYERINRHLEADKDALAKEFEQRKAEQQSAVANKDSYISNKAMELYRELQNLKKGVRASADLAYLLDRGHPWKSIKVALLNIKDNPSQRVDPRSEIESVAREMLNDSYDAAVYDAGNMDTEYQREVEKLEAEAEAERQKARDEEQKLRRADVRNQYLAEIEAGLNSRGFSLDNMLDHPKRQLSTLETVDTMPQRVMEKTFGYKEGQALADATVNKVAQNETEKIRWLDAITNRKSGLLKKMSDQYHIKPGSKEEAAVQMYAEGFFVNEKDELVAYGDAELAKDFPKAEVQKNIKAFAKDPRIRQFYDETLDKINESRVRNGYPPIPKLDNYYLHFRADDGFLSKVGIPFNPNDAKAKDLPTDMVGQTADLKPGQPFFSSGLHRNGKRTSFGVLTGMERYANSAANQIFHIDDIQRFRALQYHLCERFGQAHGMDDLNSLDPDAMAERINQVYNSHLSTFASFLHTEANILAGKTSMIDRALSEGALGRRVLTFLDAVNKQFGSAAVGGNVSSANTNWLPYIRELAISNPVDSFKAFTQTVANIFSGGKFDSFREDSPVYVRRKGADRFRRTLWQKMQDPGFALMGMVDSVSTELIARTEYNKAIREGKSPERAHYEADKKTSRLMADRSLGQMPQMHTSRFMQLALKFQLEVRNDLDSMFYDTLQEAKVSNESVENKLAKNAKTAVQVAWKYATTAVALHLFGTAFESVAGYNPAFDIIEAISKAFGLDDDEENEDTVEDNLRQGAMSLLEDMPYSSLFLGGGRIPVSSIFPDINELIAGEDEYGNEVTIGDVALDIAPYLLPTGGSQIKKTWQGLSMFSDEHPIAGSYTDSGNLRFPVDDTFGDRVQAGLFGQYASKNARDYFENQRQPLGEKQIQEFIDVDIPISDYWKYREGLAKQDSVADKFDYIAGLDLPISKKNILINNVVDRKEEVDLSGYENYSSYEEFDFATKNPGKYAISQAVGGYSSYKTYTGALSDIKADKDKNGNAISGSRKAKVVDYINSLDAEYGEKIILFKSAYPSDDTYNWEIIDYLNEREDISYEEMETILAELGFKVDSKGNISW